MFDRKILNLYAVIIGIFFIVSGIGKALDTASFSNLITQYGFGYFSVLAPFIIIAEILLGLFLILLIDPKRYSFYSFILLIVFTISFAYAYFSNGVSDCGCFGTLNHVNIPPLFSFIRNIILLVMSYLVWAKYPETEKLQVKWKRNIILPVLCISIFISGFTYRLPEFLKPAKETHKFQSQNIKNTELTKFIQTSPGKKYLFFCFSYTCPHCWNSIENLRQYYKDKSIDSVIAIATGENSEKITFEQNFKPDFFINDITAETMDLLTDSYPTAFYVENDTVKVILKSVLPSPVTFKKNYMQSKSD